MSPKKQKKPRSALRWMLKWGLIAGLLAVIAGVGVLVGGYWYYSHDLPDFRNLKDYQPPQVSRVYAADGTPIAEYFTERRTVIGRDQIPDVLVHAVLSAEDADFYKHEGLDYTGMLRALWNSVRAGHVTGSGSTITQQVVKNLVLSPERTFDRKARELILARRLEKQLTKDELLTIYLNHVYLGHGRYGMEEASRYFFGKPAMKLTVPEAAMLAGLVQSPERLSPRKHPERAKERRAYVLREMAENGYITQAQAAEATASPIQLADEPAPLPLPEAGWFAEEVRRRVASVVGEEKLQTGGFRIQTTLDLAKQRTALQALRQGLAEVDARQRYAERVQQTPESQWPRWRKHRSEELNQQPPAPGKIVPGLVTAVDAKGLDVDLGVGKARVALDALRRYQKQDGTLPWKPGAILPVAVRADGPQPPEVMHATVEVGPQGAFVAIDPVTRKVLALVGGDDFTQHPFDRAIQARRQPGSTFKPFVWGAALASKRFTPATKVIDAPEPMPLGNGRFWEPKNFSGKFEGPVALRQALARSINSVSLRLANDVGVPAVQDFARKAGIQSPLADNLTLALGSSEVAPLELANAFTTFAADGRRDAPRFVTEVLAPDGSRVPGLGTSEDAPGPEATLDPALIWVLRSMMRSVVTEGSGTKLKDVPRPVVGKTGTSNDARDCWFVGLLPDIATVTWVGFDDQRSVGARETGGHAAAPIARAFLMATAKAGPDWPPAPDGVVSVRIDKASGLLASTGGVEEWFLAGTEPKDVAPAAGEVDAKNFMFQELSDTSAPPPADGDDAEAPPAEDPEAPPAPASAAKDEPEAPPAPASAAGPASAGDPEDAPP